ncbi:hypothetical protein EYF80_015862 [Liparis tanakae]|uniref:Uncharacterized protein n=1 Tax=Liparis tanakae TaxID=230148 RepID=A0A4Z2I8W0_9TELE|nr:hypothetical protein EYF80_015862 [Liparis tanakae]
MLVVENKAEPKKRVIMLLHIGWIPDSASQQDAAPFLFGPDPTYSGGLRPVDDPLQSLSAPPAIIPSTPLHSSKTRGKRWQPHRTGTRNQEPGTRNQEPGTRNTDTHHRLTVNSACEFESMEIGVRVQHEKV